MIVLKHFALEAAHLLRSRVLSKSFPCLGAKAAFNANSYRLGFYEELDSNGATEGLSRELREFAASERFRSDRYATFIAVFRRPTDLSETTFEQKLWRQLQRLHRVDSGGWNASVSSDPGDPHFSFSFAGRAFYVIGLHANSSRIARRFNWPALIFNSHEQFEQLRATGAWHRMQETIRARDVALQGNVNPMLSDFGEQSEARQYSGRAVDANWVPPVSFQAAGPSRVEASSRKCPFTR